MLAQHASSAQFYCIVNFVIIMLTMPFVYMKKYSEKHNQDIMKKLLEEAKGQDATVSHLHIKGTINSPSIPLPFNSVVSVHRVV